MPTFQIGLDDGRTLKIDAEDHQAALAGAQHFLANEAPKDTSYTGAFRQGVANTTRGIGQTLGLAGASGAEQSGNEIADAAQAPNYQPTKVFDKGSFNPDQLLRSGAEALPGAALPVAAGALAKGLFGKYGRMAGILAGAGTALLQNLGPNVKERAANEGHDEPTTSDKLIGGATALGQSALAAAPISRLLPGANPVATVGLQGIADSAKKLAVTAGTEAASAGGQSLVGQVGATAGTPGGLQVDPNQVASAAATGGVVGAGLAAPRGAADMYSANKYRKFGGENTEASGAIAQRMSDQAPGGLANTKTGKTALENTAGDVQRELRDAVSDATKRQAFTPEVDNALSRATSGNKITDAELSTISSAVKGAPQADNIVHLVRQARVVNMLKGMGSMTDTAWSGGISGAMDKHLRPLYNPTATLAAGGAAAILGHTIPGYIGMYAPHTLAAVYGSYAAARVLDKMTGARSPAQGFANKFGNTGAPVRMPVAQPQAPQGPVAAPARPTGPFVPPVRQPWGAEPPEDLQPSTNNMMNANVKIDEGMQRIVARLAAQKKAQAIAEANAAKAAQPPEPDYASQIKEATDLMDARRANAVPNIAGVKDATELMAARRAQIKLAKANAPPPEAAPVDQTPSQIKEATDLMNARRANAALRLDQAPAAGQIKDAVELMAARRAVAGHEREQERARAAEEAANAPPEPDNGPNPLSSARELIRGLTNTAKIRAKDDKPTPEISPAPEKVAAEPNPFDAARALIKGLTNTAKIKAKSQVADPVQAAVPDAPPVIKKVSKANGKVSVVDAIREASPEPAAPTFSPKTPAELPHYGEEHADVADAKMKSKYPSLKPGTDRHQVVHEGIINGRMADETAVMSAKEHIPAGDFEAHGHLLDLLEEFHHTSSERRAREARDHYASLLPPAAKAQVLKSLNDGYIHKSKPKP